MDGQATYSAWYELLPSFAVTLNTIAVSPGDTMVASIELVNSKSDLWSLKISDATTGEFFSKIVTYNSTQSSGEWIVERPTINNQITTLADFGNVTFTNCHIEVNNVSGPLTDFIFYKVEMADSQNAMLASASNLSAGGSSFTVSYHGGK
jgi:hypothetical protein